MKNKKGFTLIELLAVIVILGVLLAIAIPAVAKYINSAKKSTYVDNVQSYVKAARQEALINNSPYALPINQNEATVIAFKKLEGALDNGGKTSSYGGTFDANSDKYQGAEIDSIGTSTMNNVCADNFPTDMYAVYEPKTVTLNFDDDNGNTSSTTCTYDGLVNLPEPPTREGYDFVGWKLQTSN